MWRWGQPVWWHLPVCLGGRPLQHHHKYSATTRHKYFCLLGGHTEQETNTLCSKQRTLDDNIPLYCWQTSCYMLYHPFCFVLYGSGIGVGVSVVAFCCRSPTIYSSISCSRRRRPPPATRPSSSRLRLQRCGMRERARQLEAKTKKWTHLWGGRGTWDKSWEWSLLSAIGQNNLLIVSQRYCYSTICNSVCNRVKKQNTQFHKIRLWRFCRPEKDIS